MEKNSFLNEWIEKQVAQFSKRIGVTENLVRQNKNLTTDNFGLSGDLINDLINKEPIMHPIKFWGLNVGWRSDKFFKIWKSIVEKSNFEVYDFNQGLLIRCEINAQDWVPHPQNPPIFALKNFNNFSNYIINNEEIFAICKNWDLENSLAITRKLQKRFSDYDFKISANYLCYNMNDFVDVAILFSNVSTDFVKAKVLWKNQNKLGELIAAYFPDVLSEYSPDWLGKQKLDFFIPSLSIGFEYQGRQHYEPVDFFGGNQSFLQNLERDKIKAMKCKSNNIKLIEWSYNELIHYGKLKEKLARIGIELF
jgi:hypothetical protein